MRSCLEGMGRGANSIQLQDKRTSRREGENSGSKTFSAVYYNRVFHETIFNFSFHDMTEIIMNFEQAPIKIKWFLNPIKACWFGGIV